MHKLKNLIYLNLNMFDFTIKQCIMTIINITFSISSAFSSKFFKSVTKLKKSILRPLPITLYPDTIIKRIL